LLKLSIHAREHFVLAEALGFSVFTLISFSRHKKTTNLTPCVYDSRVNMRCLLWSVLTKAVYSPFAVILVSDKTCYLWL